KPGGLFTPLPTNVSFAALKIYMNKTLSNSGGDSLVVGIWVADESGKVIARLTLSAADFSAGRSATFIPYCNNGIFFQKALQNHR
ncbi:MAG: hypothetical protein QXZ09_09015, partial [Candidatus Methanomethylicaceae archaeon]